MQAPQRIVRNIDAHFPIAAIWLRFIKHKLEGNRELAVARRYMKEGSLVLDVGARKGIYTWVMSREVGRAGKVVAFEPNPESANSLRYVFASHSNVEIHECALSDQARRGILSVPLEDGVAQDALGHLSQPCTEVACLSYEIQIRTLDEFIGKSDQTISFIKIDVEGHELSVLRGGQQTLAEHRPVIFAEIEQRHAQEPIRSRFEFLESHGYRTYFLNLRGGISPISAFHLESMQVEPSQAKRRFVNMFLFVPGERPQP